MSQTAFSADDASLTSHVIQQYATQYEVNIDTLNDYINTYDFKCPKILTDTQLKSLLKDELIENELQIMIESERMQWRDVYLDARENISCLN